MSQGLNAAFGWSAGLVAVLIAILAAVIAIWGHDWVHRVFRVILVFSLPIVTILSVGVVLGLAHGHAPHQHFGFTLAAFMRSSPRPRRTTSRTRHTFRTTRDICPRTPRRAR